MLSVKFFATGCQMLATSHKDSHEIRHALKALASEMADAEATYSRFIDDSELMILNRQRTMTVSKRLLQMLQHALAMAHFTQGLISPNIYHALSSLGYQKSFYDIMTASPFGFDTDTQTPIGNATHQDIILNTTTCSVSLPDGVYLDLGGFAKVLSATQAAQRFYERTGTGVLLDAGGDIIIKDDNKANPWTIHLPTADDIGRHLPHHAITPCPTLPQSTHLKRTLSGLGWVQIYKHPAPISLEQSSILSTSGIDYRHWQVLGKFCHHLIHPTQQQSPITDIVNASVLIHPPKAHLATPQGMD